MENKAKISEAVQQLIAETEGYSDAALYARDVATELGCSDQEVLDELRRQCGRLEAH